jgi:hypothetical protein
VAAPVAGVCAPWITGADIGAACCADLAKRASAAAFSVNLLYRLSGRQYPGLCQRTIRPCGVGCAAWARWPAYRDSWFPAYYNAGGGWTGGAPALAGCGCTNRCRLPSVTLPGPVTAVTEVVIDGAVLDPSTYQVVGHRRLERLDGGTWPCSQNLAADAGVGGVPGTFQVTYTFGRNPDAGGILAAQEYGCEVAKHLCGASDCQLPQRTRSVVRQGITFDLTTPLDFLDQGRTGVPLVDLWLTSVNPAKLPRRATVRRFDTEVTSPTSTGPSIGFYTVAGYADQVTEADILALIAAHPDLVKVTYQTAAVSGVPVDGWYLHNGTLASFTGRTWPVIWEGTAAQIPAQGVGAAQFQTGDIAITRITTL